MLCSEHMSGACSNSRYASHATAGSGAAAGIRLNRHHAHRRRRLAKDDRGQTGSPRSEGGTTGTDVNRIWRQARAAVLTPELYA
jgi:hypothetical protein